MPVGIAVSRPLPELHSERSLIRMAGTGDVAAVLDFYRENKAFLDPWEPNRPMGFYTEGWWKAMVIKSAEEFKADRALRLFMFRRSEPKRIVGSVNFANFIRGAFHACHLGYSIAEAEQGKGLMTEALKPCLSYVFSELNMHRVMANYMHRNVRSARVLERLGFEKEGEARAYLFIHGKWEDHVLTSLINPDWKNPAL